MKQTLGPKCFHIGKRILDVCSCTYLYTQYRCYSVGGNYTRYWLSPTNYMPVRATRGNSRLAEDWSNPGPGARVPAQAHAKTQVAQKMLQETQPHQDGLSDRMVRHLRNRFEVPSMQLSEWAHTAKEATHYWEGRAGVHTP